LHVDLAVGEACDLRVGERHTKVLGDLLRERTVRVAAEQLQVVGHRALALKVVGAGGFEPPNTGSQVPRLAAWPRPGICISVIQLFDPRGHSTFVPPSSPSPRASAAGGSAARARTIEPRRTPWGHSPTSEPPGPPPPAAPPEFC